VQRADKVFAQKWSGWSWRAVSKCGIARPPLLALVSLFPHEVVIERGRRLETFSHLSLFLGCRHVSPAGQAGRAQEMVGSGGGAVQGNRRVQEPQPLVGLIHRVGQDQEQLVAPLTDFVLLPLGQGSRERPQ